MIKVIYTMLIFIIKDLELYLYNENLLLEKSDI